MASGVETAVKAIGPKKHGACDECRLRKVKCSAEQDGCTRCRDEAITCRYSDKKTMGRPRKRPRDSDTIQQEGNISGDYAVDQLDVGYLPTSSNADNINASTTPPTTTLNDTITATSYATTSDAPHNIDPTLDSSNDWGTVNGATPNGYEPAYDQVGSSTATDRTMIDVALPAHYPRTPQHLSNAASTDYPCSCLDQLHLMLQSFRSMPPTSFPSSRYPLTRATNLARVVTRCTVCPLDFPTALQTSMLLTTLLRLIGHGYATLVGEIDAQKAEGRRITCRVGELSYFNAHLHTGTLDCPMGFNIELDPEEWAAMARKVLKQDIYGNSQSVDCLVGVIEELEQRHQTWHLLQIPSSETDAACRNHHPQSQGLFLQLIRHIRAVIEDLEL
ncbi:MAG: hypothetical protein Q9213_005612 [Squamulea squamosa]